MQPQEYKKLHNLTPHSITIYIGDNAIVILSELKDGLRLESKEQKHIGNASDGSGIPIFTPQIFTGLVPQLANDTDNIIVSMPVAQWMVNNMKTYKGQILSPGTGPNSVIRNPQTGQIIGVRFLELHNYNNNADIF